MTISLTSATALADFTFEDGYSAAIELIDRLSDVTRDRLRDYTPELRRFITDVMGQHGTYPLPEDRPSSATNLIDQRRQYCRTLTTAFRWMRDMHLGPFAPQPGAPERVETAPPASTTVSPPGDSVEAIPAIFTEAAMYGRMHGPTVRGGRSGHLIRLDIAAYVRAHNEQYRDALTAYRNSGLCADRPSLDRILGTERTADSEGLLWLPDFAHWYIAQRTGQHWFDLLHPSTFTTPTTTPEGAPMTVEIDEFRLQYNLIPIPAATPARVNAIWPAAHQAQRAFLNLPMAVKERWRDTYNRAVASGGFDFSTVDDFDRGQVASQSYGYSTETFFAWARREGITIGDDGAPVPSSGAPVVDTHATVAEIREYRRLTVANFRPWLGDFGRWVDQVGPGRSYMDANWRTGTGLSTLATIEGRGPRTGDGPQSLGSTMPAFANWLNANGITAPTEPVVPQGGQARPVFDVDMSVEALVANRVALLTPIGDLVREYATSNGIDSTFIEYMITGQETDGRWSALDYEEMYARRILEWLRQPGNRSRIPMTTSPQGDSTPVFDADMSAEALWADHAALLTPIADLWREWGAQSQYSNSREWLAFMLDGTTGDVTYWAGRGDLWTSPGQYLDRFLTWLREPNNRSRIPGTTPTEGVTITDTATPGQVIPIGPEHPGWQAFAERMAAAATANSMCPEYDRIAAEMQLPTRKDQVTYRITIEVPVTLPRGHNADDRVLREAAAAIIEQRGSVNRANKTELRREQVVAS